MHQLRRVTRRHASPIREPSPSSPDSRQDCRRSALHAHKAITAVKLYSRRREHQVPAVAVFGVESEDPTGTKSRHASYSMMNFTGAPYPAGTVGGRPDADRAAETGEHLNATIDQLAATLPSTEFTKSIVGDLRDAYRPGVSMAESLRALARARARRPRPHRV